MTLYTLGHGICLFAIPVLNKRGQDHNMTQFNTKEQATLQLALCTVWKKKYFATQLKITQLEYFFLPNCNVGQGIVDLAFSDFPLFR